MPAASLQHIQSFLNAKSVALIGASRDEKSYSRSLLRELQRVGMQVVPVNPSASEIEGLPCAAEVGEVQPLPQAALIVTAPARSDGLIRDSVAAGIKIVWARGGAGPKTVTAETRQLCDQRGVALIEGYCPLMFLPQAVFVHRLHAFLVRLAGRYPR
jgi:acyl-CoA synthetase (NDP forming)